MTDQQLLIGIMHNDERVWKHMYRNMKSGFASIIVRTFPFSHIENDDIEDIFQESLIVLMQKIKKGGFVISREGALFSYLVQIGKLTACNLIRKRKDIKTEDVVTIYNNLHKEYEEIPVDEKQKTQDEFLDIVIDSLPPECKKLLKHFYWEHKPMDQIASMLGMRNADSAKTKKTRCMDKLREFAKRLVGSDEFAEEVVRAAVERAALKELLEDERIYAESRISMAALNTDKDAEE